MTRLREDGRVVSSGGHGRACGLRPISFQSRLMPIVADVSFVSLTKVLAPALVVGDSGFVADCTR